jgi:FPC/CPF motif-containing protein YcgG
MGSAVESLARSLNPFDSPLAVEHSNYCWFDGKRLIRQADGQPGSKITAFVHESFRALALNEHFTCVGAKAALRQGGYRFALYPELASAPSCAGLARDLFTFTRERVGFDSEFSTFIASFSDPIPPDEATFERLLWRTLQGLNDLDAAHHGWSREVAANTSDPHFSFSFAETAFFVVGLHAGSSRAARRFAWPTLVFNPHEQFDALKKAGRYQRFQQVIREAEESLQGDINPMLAAFGERSEASQYSGRQVGSDWRCPFHANVPDRQEAERDDSSTG